MNSFIFPFVLYLADIFISLYLCTCPFLLHFTFLRKTLTLVSPLISHCQLNKSGENHVFLLTHSSLNSWPQILLGLFSTARLSLYSNTCSFPVLWYKTLTICITAPRCRATSVHASQAFHQRRCLMPALTKPGLGCMPSRPCLSYPGHSFWNIPPFLLSVYLSELNDSQWNKDDFFFQLLPYFLHLFWRKTFQKCWLKLLSTSLPIFFFP